MNIKLKFGSVGRLAGAALLVTAAGFSSAGAHDTLTDLGGGVDRGAVNSYQSSTPQPWVRKYFAAANTCLHFQVVELSAAVDLKMVVVAPEVGVVYRDDDSGASNTCFNCPRINISSVPLTGYYTVIVSQWNGSPADVNFTLAFQRASLGSAICTPANTTLPVAPSAGPKQLDTTRPPNSAFGE